MKREQPGPARILLTLLFPAALLLLSGCENEPAYPEATVSDAVLAMEDLLLVSGTSMFLLFEADTTESGAVANDTESVRLAWEGVDNEAGIGTYTISLAEHRVGTESIFAADYNGYIMSGSIVLAAAAEGGNSMTADLELGHEEPEEFPVRRLVLEIDGSEEVEGRLVPTGELLVNGETVELALMAEAFE